MHACDIVAEPLEFDDAARRIAYVEKTCGTDGALYERVLAMLHFHDANHKFLSETTFDYGLVGERLGEAIGSVIGKYKLLEEIGEGGFGTVYLAEQTERVSGLRSGEPLLLLLHFRVEARDTMTSTEVAHATYGPRWNR